MSAMGASKIRTLIARRDVIGVLVALAVVTFARSSLADHYHVPTGSMVPTVAVKDRVVVNKLAYGLRIPFTDTYLFRTGDPARGEVVVLESPEDATVLLKRVVATPGDRVRVVDGELEINGRRVPVVPAGKGFTEQLGTHHHPVDFKDGGGPAFGPAIVPPDHYLVMGDNRGNSHDGRMFGFVKRESLLGRAAGVFLRNGSPRWIPL